MDHPAVPHLQLSMNPNLLRGSFLDSRNSGSQRQLPKAERRGGGGSASASYAVNTAATVEGLLPASSGLNVNGSAATGRGIWRRACEPGGEGVEPRRSGPWWPSPGNWRCSCTGSGSPERTTTRSTSPGGDRKWPENTHRSSRVRVTAISAQGASTPESSKQHRTPSDPNVHRAQRGPARVRMEAWSGTVPLRSAKALWTLDGEGLLMEAQAKPSLQGGGAAAQ